MTEHKFGGPWTEIKLNVLRNYLNFYTKALKNTKFELLYIDGCAGTGNRTEIIPAAPMLGDNEETQISRDGSAKIALETKPPFDKYLFIEENKKRFAELKTLKYEYEDLYVEVENGNANNIITKITKRPIWDKNKYRGVIFLDPYGLQINWTTLKAIASTKSFDVCFLFSLSGVCRQAPLRHESMTPDQKQCLTRVFGTDEWEKDFYKPNENQQTSFLDYLSEPLERTANVQQIEKWVKERLEKCFPFVEEPLPLCLPKGAQLYSLFICVSNPSQKAIDLARRVANHILKQQ